MSLSNFDDRAAILTDVTRCTGCETCVAACKERNHLPPDKPRRWKERIDALSSTRFTTILRQPENRYVRQQCRHCNEPACASACIVGALHKTPEGPVIYRRERCMGCRYCILACPFGIPRYNWEDFIPSLHKCTLCYDSLKDGGKPACTEACPHQATVFGKRGELLAEAHRRLAAEPGKYKVQKVYGESEVGGVSVLYISDVPLDFLAWKAELGERPAPERTWDALKKVPYVAGGVGLGMAGVWWVIGRRMQRQAEAMAAAASATENTEKSEA